MGTQVALIKLSGSQRRGKKKKEKEKDKKKEEGRET